MNRRLMLINLGLVAVAMITLNQNCSKAAFSENASNANPPVTPFVIDEPTPNDDLSDVVALAYGASAEDRAFLAAKIRGTKAPALSEIFGRWRRFVDSTIYATAQQIPVDPAIPYCYTDIDPATGEWKAGVKDGKPINPATNSVCVNSAPFTAASWTHLASPERIHIGVNGGNINGFISALPFENFTNEAVIGSTAKDDDEMALVIAAVVDKAGVLHTLLASRSQGGQGSSLGFGIIYRRGKSVVSKVREIAVGPVNPGTSTGDEDKGWNGRLSRVRVERKGDLISVYASPNGTVASKLVLSPQSRLDVDLSDKSLGLEIFRGAHYYGYSTVSQQSAEFSAIKFTSTTNEQFVYDLHKDLVYQQKATGGYAVVAGQSAVETLGYPRKVLNPEIQRQFHLNKDKTFSVIDN